MTAAPLLEVRGLRKEYPGVVALGGVDFTLRAGEVHALVGENGAGKSTLVRCIGGVGVPDGGEMFLQGRPYAPVSRHAARRAGVCMVMQELNLIPTLSVAENIGLDELPRRWGFVAYRQLHEEAQAVMRLVGLEAIDPARPVGELGVGQQQMVEIAAALRRRADVLILDEPTAALTYAETDLLFARLGELRAAGVGVIYISHRMEEIKRIADRITILRDGMVVATRAAKELETEEIVRLMVGREVEKSETRNQKSESNQKSENRDGAEALRVEGLSCGFVRDVSFTVRRGEILGFAGLMGSGRTETMRAVFGADRAEAGRVFLHGAAAPAVIRNPRDAVENGLALLTEDRKGQGLWLGLSLRENVTLANLTSVAVGRTWVKRAAQEQAAAQVLQALQVRCRGLEQTVGELSGGNQQKVVLAKWMLRDCAVLIFDEPTRGIDVGARQEIYRLLHELAGRGKAILVVSSDLKELLAICDRIAVMSAGRLAATFARAEWTQEAIMAAALSGYQSGKLGPGAPAGSGAG